MSFSFKTDVSSGGNSFIKLKDGESVTGVLAGEKKEYHYLGGYGKPMEEVPPGTYGARFKFKMNFIVVENGKLVPKILDAGKQIYNALKELAGNGGPESYDLSRYRIKISRSGSGQFDTEYTVMPLPNGALTDAQMKQIQAVELLPLESKKDNTGFKDTGMTVDKKFTSDDIPW